MARLFSEELTQQSIEACNADSAHLERARILTGVLVLRALDDPDAKDVMITYTFDAGRCTDWKYEAQAAPSSLRKKPFTPLKDGLARVTAKYDTWAKLDKGEITPAQALTSPDYNVEGNLLLLMPLMPAVESFNQKVRGIAKEY